MPSIMLLLMEPGMCMHQRSEINGSTAPSEQRVPVGFGQGYVKQ